MLPSNETGRRLFTSIQALSYTNILYVAVSFQNSPGTKADGNSSHSEDKHHKRRSGALPASKQGREKPHFGMTRHKRLAYIVNHNSTEEQPNWYGEKLKRVPAGVDTSLKFDRNGTP